MNNYTKVKKVLWLILFANIFVAVVKIVTGFMVKSTSITADGYHSLTDGSSNVIALIGIVLASKPADNDHPYGHGKFETLSGMLIAGILTFAGGKIVYNAIIRFFEPAVLQITLASLILLIITLIINILVCTYEYRQGKALNSHILIHDSLHTKSDIYISTGVLVALICIKSGLPFFIDSIVSLIVSIFIFHAAYGIFCSTRDILVDKAALDIEKIREIALSFDKVKDVHNIRSRRNETDTYIDMHLLTEPDMNVEESHTLMHDIENKMKNAFSEHVQLIVHIEPEIHNTESNDSG